MKIIDMEVTCSDCGSTWQKPIISRHAAVAARQERLGTIKGLVTAVLGR